MGYQQGRHCFDTIEQAANYAGAQMAGQVISSAHGEPWAISYEGYNGSELKFGLHGQASARALQVPYQPVACQMIEMDDAAEMSWLVVGAWAVAFGIRLAVNAIKG